MLASSAYSWGGNRLFVLFYRLLSFCMGVCMFSSQYKVFGPLSESYYGALKNRNPALEVPEIITGVIDTTAYNRIPSLQTRLFAWIDEVNATLSDDVLEVVIVGVGNSAYVVVNSEHIRKQGSPQVIETLVALIAINHRKINLTLIDRNPKSLAMAANFAEFDFSPYFLGVAISAELKECMEKVCIYDEAKKTYRADINKFRHIKINTFCVDITKIKFPLHRADMLITTFTMIYLDENKTDGVLCNMMNSLKPRGKMITTNGYFKHGPYFHFVTELPADNACTKDIIYFNLDSANTSLNYCFFSLKYNRIIRNNATIEPDDFAVLQQNIAMINNSKKMTPGCEKLILRALDYTKYNLVSNHRMKKGMEANCVSNSIIFFSSYLKRNATTAFTYQFFASKSARIFDELHEVTAYKLDRLRHP
jgi:hypothetical protein